VQGNLHAPFGKRTTEKDLHHRHLAGAPLHSASGLGKRTGSNPDTAPQVDSTIRLRGLAVAGSEAAGRKSPDNHTQTAGNPRRSLQNAAAGARLIQAEGLDSKSAADVAVSLAAALEELSPRPAQRRFVTADRIVESRGGYDPEGDPPSPSLRRKHVLISGMCC
jgi:hypothetical protein